MSKLTMPTHECPREGCTRQVPQNQFACRSDWYRVSKATRDEIWETYLSGDFTAHAEAMARGTEELNR